MAFCTKPQQMRRGIINKREELFKLRDKVGKLREEFDKGVTYARQVELEKELDETIVEIDKI